MCRVPLAVKIVSTVGLGGAVIDFTLSLVREYK
jgi:hypothetical protein